MYIRVNVDTHTHIQVHVHVHVCTMHAYSSQAHVVCAHSQCTAMTRCYIQTVQPATSANMYNVHRMLDVYMCTGTRTQDITCSPYVFTCKQRCAY